MAAQSTQQPKEQLVLSKKAFNKALWPTPMAFGATLIAMGFHNDVVFWVVGGVAFLYSLYKITIAN